MEQYVPNELIGALTASTTLLRIEARGLRAEGKDARAKSIEVQLDANDEVLAKYGGPVAWPR